MLAAYLELIQLTERVLLEHLPPKKHQPLPTLKAPSPLPGVPKEIAKTTPPQPIVEIKTPEINKDFGDILNLIRAHCPKLKIIECPPLSKKTIHLLLNPQSDSEKMLGINLASALKKEGYEFIETLETADLLIAERAILLNHPLKMNIKRNSQGHLKLSNIHVIVIPSLAELILHPEKKRSLWMEILKVLKSS